MQEWITKYPSALGEELLIIQKEFDSFDRENWPEMIQWMTEYVPKLEKAFGLWISKISTRLRNTPFAVEDEGEFQAGNPTGSVSESPNTP